MRFFFCLLGLLVSSQAFSQNKLALIVAVGEYPADSRLTSIAAVNDVKYIKAVLNKNGFADNNIQLLINAKATKAAILKSLSELAAKAKKDDIVVLHFGCHGQQIRDQKTVELGKDEEDGFDEALLPYDAKSRYSPTSYHGENHLRDDDLYPKLMAIRQAIGPGGSLLVLLDACYSGTGTRSESFAGSRGVWFPFLDPENPVDSVINLPNVDAKQGFFDGKSDSVSNMVVISGSGPHQENKQVLVNNEELGSLSYAFCKAMGEMPPGSDYGLLFEKIKATIQAFIPEQVPMLEGNASQVIFSGKFIPKTERTFIRVGIKTIPSVQDTLFTMEKGMMDNIAVGTGCTIFRAGSKEKFADGVIRKVENFRSIGVSNKPLKRNELYEIKETEENYGKLAAGISLKFEPMTRSSRLEAQVKQLIQPYRFLTLSDNADYQLAVKDEPGNRKVSLKDRNDKLLWLGDLTPGDSLSADDKKQVIVNIKNALRVKYLRTMPDGGDLAPYVSAEVVPSKEYDITKAVVLEAGDGYSLKIRNNTDEKLFYTVLDIYPDNQVNVLYPYKGKEAADYLLEPHSVVIRKLSVSKGTPVGTEFLKIIFSKEPMDLRSVFEQTVRRDAMRSFQVVLDDLFNEKGGARTTRGDIASIKVEEIGIVTVHFKIK